MSLFTIQTVGCCCRKAFQECNIFLVCGSNNDVVRDSNLILALKLLDRDLNRDHSSYHRGGLEVFISTRNNQCEKLVCSKTIRPSVSEFVYRQM